jgi:predicted dehydrogenase
LRVSIVGLGAAATRGHLPALRKLEREGRVEVVAACDPDGRRRMTARRAMRRLLTFESADEMLGSIDSELTVIAAPPHVHASLAVLAAEHGQHIVCEKPAGCTPADVRELATIWRQHQDRALFGSYQYRFSRPWLAIASIVRAAVRSDRRIVMSVQVQRDSTDRHAISNWRVDPAMGGGFADHAVHFLALGREIGQPFAFDRATRNLDHAGREKVNARLFAGANLLDLSVSYQAQARSTTLALSFGDKTICWRDGVLEIERKGQPTHRFSVPSLSDRSHVDALYLPMYRDLLAGVESLRWRRDRAEEVTAVGRCLTVLLAETERGVPVEPPALAA